MRPTSARQVVLAFAVTLAVITFIDRVCISQAAPFIRADLHLTESQMGWVFAAFTLTYALFEIPMGRMGDRSGPRRVLLKVVMFWSFFTAATGWVWNYTSLVVCRLLFGAGEAGCFPNITKIFTIWLPSLERNRAQGILWLSARWGGAFTPLLVALILAQMSWRWMFGLFGLLGVVWAVAFARWFRDRPAEHPSVNAAELALLDGAEINAPSQAPVPWALMLRNPTVWLLWWQYFTMAYGWYFYITWLPTYLRDAKHVPLDKSALLAGLPLFFGGMGSFVSGWLVKRLAERWGNLRLARRALAGTGLTLAGLMLVVATQISSPVLGMMALGLASFFNDLAMAPGWGACMDVGGRHAGALSGSFNMMGNLGGVVGPVVVGYILGYGKILPADPPLMESWTFALLLAAAVYWLGALAWVYIDPVTPFDRPEEKTTAQPSASLA